MTAKVALVTGGSSGIGEESARLLQDAGFTVYAVARRVERMQDLAARGVRVFDMDVTDEESMSSGVKRILAEAGRIDVLVNTAGYGSYGPVEEVPIDEARRQFEVNVFGLARLSQLVLPHMRAQGSGRIINISSIGARFYEPLGGWYHATKFAVDGLSDSMRLELRPFGVDVVLIAPGPILTEWNEIARRSLLEQSEGTAYAGQARSVVKVLERADRPGMAAPAAAVGRTVVKAATASRPRSRYPVGRGAGTIIRSRNLLPDRVFDAIVSRMYLR